MNAAEDYEFVVQTDTGNRRAVISKTALRTLSGRSGASPSDVAATYRAELEELVLRKLASGTHGSSDVIRLYGTDL
jgi:hypothetical protein